MPANTKAEFRVLIQNLARSALIRSQVLSDKFLVQQYL
jgi:hypothetical protein